MQLYEMHRAGGIKYLNIAGTPPQGTSCVGTHFGRRLNSDPPTFFPIPLKCYIPKRRERLNSVGPQKNPMLIGRLTQLELAKWLR